MHCQQINVQWTLSVDCGGCCQVLSASCHSLTSTQQHCQESWPAAPTNGWRLASGLSEAEERICRRKGQAGLVGPRCGQRRPLGQMTCCRTVVREPATWALAGCNTVPVQPGSWSSPSKKVKILQDHPNRLSDRCMSGRADKTERTSRSRLLVACVLEAGRKRRELEHKPVR